MPGPATSESWRCSLEIFSLVLLTSHAYENVTFPNIFEIQRPNPLQRPRVDPKREALTIAEDS
jgi:hypothetical protein